MSSTSDLSSQGRVCIADHDPNDVGVLGDLLRRHGYEVHIATNGQAALEIIAETPPDVALLELDLPEIHGLEVCRRLEADPRSAHVPVIFLGWSVDLRTRVDALENGGTDFIARPFSPEEVLARVKRQVTVSRVRAALQESEAKFRSVMESAIDAIVSADDRGIIRSWNRAAEQLFGYRAEDIVGLPIERIVPERYRSAHGSGLQRVAAGGPSRVIGSTVEVAGLHESGHEIPVELSLATWKLDGKRYFTGILRDIRERKEAEEKYRSVTESAIDAIVSADHEGIVIGWNKAAEGIFGWPAEEIVGRSLETIIPERFRPAHRAGVDRMTRTGQGRAIGKTLELSGLRRDGTEIPIELSLSTWTAGADRFYTGIIRDIHERKEAESRLRRYADELERKHRELEAKHRELERSRQALAASHERNQRLFAAVTDGLPGAVLNGKYRLVSKMASGGCGVVYRGVQLALDRVVAIKLLRPATEELLDELAVRFRREGATTCRVQHPRAVSVIDHDVSEGGFPYIVMEYLEGETLAARLDAMGALPLREALAIAADVCSVLAAAHDVGVIHRDIKPGNVFLQRSRRARGEETTVKVLDFGLAKWTGETDLASVTRPGSFLGTPCYMAPERLPPNPQCDHPASDVYSVAVLLYQTLAGRLPVPPRDTLLHTIQAILDGDYPALQALAPDVPESVTDLVMRGMSPDPTQRPTTAAMECEIRRELEAAPTVARAGEAATSGPCDQETRDWTAESAQ